MNPNGAQLALGAAMRSPLKNHKSYREQATVTEDHIAKSLGGKRIPNSGAMDGAKGDVKTKDFLIDSKETGANSIVVSASQLNKISKEAREAGKSPALVITLGQTSLGTSRQWAIIPIGNFRELIDD